MRGTGRRAPYYSIIGLTLLVFVGVGCAQGGPIRSQVLDAQTGKPVPGAVVLGVWTKTVGFGFTRTERVGVREADVDADGRFTLDRPDGTSSADESITVYKFGYVAWNNKEVFPTYERRKDTSVPAQILLELFPPGTSHVRHMNFVDGVTRGSTPDPTTRSKFQRAIERENRMN